MSRPRRLLLYSGVGVLLMIAVLTIIGLIVVRSSWFHDKVRDRIVEEVEHATGGKAEIGSFQFDWESMTASVRPFVLHGKERAGDPPLLQAESVDVGLKIISALKRDVDVASLVVQSPQVNLLVYPDGSTNLPSPRLKSDKDPVQRLLELAVKKFEIRNGLLHFRSERTPFDIRGENLRAAFDYDASGPLYKAHLASSKLRFNSNAIGPLAVDLDTDVRLLRDRIEVTRARMTTKESRATASGVLRNITAPQGDFDFRAGLALGELGTPLHIPIEHRGTAEVEGKLRFAFGEKFTWYMEGNLAGRDLAFRRNDTRVSGVTLRSTVEVNPAGARLRNVVAKALGGTFTGTVGVRKFRDLEIEGQISGVSLEELSHLQKTHLVWSGVASGQVQVAGTIEPQGLRGLNARVDATIAPAPGGVPVQGHVTLAYSDATGTIDLGESHLSTPQTQVTLSGTLGRTLRLSVQSTDLRELEPALAMAGQGTAPLPVQLARNGKAAADLTLTGASGDPHVTGRVSLTDFEYDGQHWDGLTADVDATSSHLRARNAVLSQGALRLNGSGEIELAQWKPADASRLSASVQISGADIKRLLEESGRKDIPVSGVASGVLAVGGTLDSPVGNGHLKVDHPSLNGQQFDAADTELRLSPSGLDITGGSVRLGKSRLQVNGSYQHESRDWTTGKLRFDVVTGDVPLASIQEIGKYRPGVTGTASLHASGTAHVTKGVFDLDTLDSRAAIRALALDDVAFGNLQMTATTRADVLDLRVEGNIHESKVEGGGEWRLTGDYPGQAEFRFTPVRVSTLKALAATAGAPKEVPFQGTVEGKVSIRGPLKKPEALVIAATLPRVELTPAQTTVVRAGARPEDIILKNVGPVVLSGTKYRLTFQSAHFSAKDTNLEVTGSVAFNEKSPWDAAVRGTINLAILQLFNADLVAQGSAIVNTSIRGALRDPQVNGRLELQNASLYLGDIPVGLDRANGVVLFDRNRATIQKLSAEVGGGRLDFGGFVGFGGGLVVYRVQATADQVRIRYPEGVSTTINAALNLTGTSANSLVSGTVTVIRAGFNPKTDVGGILAATATPVPAPETPNDYFRTVQFDVRIESGPSLEFTTALARGVQAEAELRLRGTAARPVLLGTVTVNEGEVQVFGNKYTINRGEVRFINPTRIEPYIDVDMQTRARGIDVTISFTGTINKLNMTYRSDPPLQPNDIIALLAMGRDPTAMAGLANAQVASQSLLQTGSGVVGQAITAPVSDRLQRFFGVSRVKIDPQLTGVENIPQARLTVEQAISRDVTLTYITNLARTNEQIVRVQWDINRRWSAIAIRQENGVFGIDFQYKKTFK